MPTTHIPKYPVVDPSPTMSKTISNFNFTDYRNIAAFSTSGYLFGWLTARKPFRIPQSRFLFVIGSMAGICYASLSSMQRLMGLENNEREVVLYGILSPEQLAIKQKQLNTPNLQLVDSDAD